MDDDAQMREVLSRVGSVMTPRKRQAQAENIGRFNAQPRTEEYKAKLREGQKARRERERAAREEQGVQSEATEKRTVGRPRTRPLPDPDAPKRGRGRPPKPNAPKEEG